MREYAASCCQLSHTEREREGMCSFINTVLCFDDKHKIQGKLLLQRQLFIITLARLQEKKICLLCVQTVCVQF